MIVRDHVRGMLLGCAVGDALGMPLEGMDEAAISKRFGRVVSMRAHPDDGRRGGAWTDDTQLTMVVMASLAANRGLDIPDMADLHVEAYLHSDGRGWGSSTITACERMYRGSGARDAGKIGAAGDGTAMKAAPVGAFVHLTGGGVSEVLEISRELALMTHRDVRAVVGMSVQALCAYRVCEAVEQGGFPDQARVMEEAITVARGIERADADLSPHYLREMADPDNIYSEKLGLVRDWLASGDDERALVEKVGNGFYVNEAGPFSLGMFLRYGSDLRGALVRTINTGGDTDTTGAMVGSLAGLWCGSGMIPVEWLDSLQSRDIIREFADGFFESLKGEDRTGPGE